MSGAREDTALLVQRSSEDRLSGPASMHAAHDHRSDMRRRERTRSLLL
ncbi:hypothetical protein [Filomicrobium sp.]|nr:hypothetical protein [Filomicrobium sp.]MCV0368930.1 hypothetical protein [Filomicrobium sp.]